MTRRRSQAYPVPDEPGWHGVAEALAAFAVLILIHAAVWISISAVPVP